MPLRPLAISAYTLSSAVGLGCAATVDALQQRRSGLRRCDFPGAALDTWIGRVDDVEAIRIRGELAAFDCRNNRLALLGLEQDGFAERVRDCRARYGADRVGVFLGTSTSGIQQTERAYAQRQGAERLAGDYDYRHTHDIFSAVDFVSRHFALRGPRLSISTACSSSAKVFASAYRHIHSGLCDAALVGGVDSLCLTTLYGFNSLGLISHRPCRPWDRDRDGINIGEAAGFALLERAEAGDTRVALLGYGESGDAHHISSPHPQGEGAALAMQRALVSAELTADRIDYINLHGTATPANDLSEDRAVQRVFGADTRCSSTKGWTGHTLGAAGIVEALIACLSIEHGFLPATLNLDTADPALHSRVLTGEYRGPIRRALSNSFGFGGSNCSLLFGKNHR